MNTIDVMFYRNFAHFTEFRMFAEEAQELGKGYGFWAGKCTHWMEAMQLCLFE